MAQQAVQERFLLALTRRPDREARPAAVEVRYTTLTLRRPRRSTATPSTLTVSVVDVREPHPPAGEKAVHWLLLTSLPVDTLAEAHLSTQWYSYRWLIERLHYVLKSGCKLEDRQLRLQVRLERLLAVFTLVAWHLLWLTSQARQAPDVPCTIALHAHEWQALYAHHHSTLRLPTTPPTLGQAVRWIAQLGGFMARRRDGDPGVKVLWRGWSRLQDLAHLWRLFHPPRVVGNV